MINFKRETLLALGEKGFTTNDIKVIMVSNEDESYLIFPDNFFNVADFEYSNDYGNVNINPNLIIIMKNGTWFCRSEYDGKEKWEHRHYPKQPHIYKYISKESLKWNK